MRLWCEHAWLGGPRASRDVLLDVDDGWITRVEPGASAPGQGVERVPGLTLPGLVNAHSHAFHRALRGRTQGETGSFWTWRDRMYELAARLTPTTFERLATAAFGEMALAGVTTVGEFHYLHHGPGGEPYDDPNLMGHALVRAAMAAGVRLTLLDACYLRGGLDQPLSGAQQRFGDGTADRWMTRLAAFVPGTANVRVGAAAHSVRAVAPADLERVAAWADARGAVLHAHVSEQPAENEACLAAYGETPTGLLAAAGALGPRFTAVHATHLTAGDLGLLGGASASVCLCPTTERELADGVGPAAALTAAGSPLCLGSDSQAVVDLFEEARAVELDERLLSRQRGLHVAADLLTAATRAGAVSLDWPEAGELTTGAAADLVVVDLTGVRLAGTPDEALLDAAVFAGSAADVAHVMVDGRWVVRNGRHVRLDVPHLLDHAVRAAWEADR
jgi:formiminoglutamate deiminase